MASFYIYFLDLFNQGQRGTKRPPFFSFRGPKNKKFKRNDEERKNNDKTKGKFIRKRKQEKTNASKRDFRPIGDTKKKFSKKK